MEYNICSVRRSAGCTQPQETACIRCTLQLTGDSPRLRNLSTPQSIQLPGMSKLSCCTLLRLWDLQAWPSRPFGLSETSVRRAVAVALKSRQVTSPISAHKHPLIWMKGKCLLLTLFPLFLTLLFHIFSTLSHCHIYYHSHSLHFL